MRRGEFDPSMHMPGDGVRETKSDPEKLIASEPKLRYIGRALELLRPEINQLGEEENWKDLYKEVKPWANSLELSDNVRDAVREYIAKKIPRLQERAPSLGDLSDKKVLEALTNNWFEEVGEEVEGTRREVLLAVMAHVVKRIESRVYRKILGESSETDLQKLALNQGLRDLTVAIMETSEKADPLFIRFMAYAQLSGKPPEEASSAALYLPGDDRPHTIASLFPHETQFLSKRFAAIAADSGGWIHEPGGEVFKRYLEALGHLYEQIDAQQAEKAQEVVLHLYEELLAADFPVLLTPATEGLYKEPYWDPELKVSLATPDARREEGLFHKAKEAMAGSLDALGMERFSTSMRSRSVRSVDVLGGYGVNVYLNAVAQEKPAILIYRNDQIRAYDRDFPAYMEISADTPERFGDLDTVRRTALMEKMSRMNTVLHELAHSMFLDESPEAERMGRVPLTAIDEIKAEIGYRALMPHVLKKEDLKEPKSSGRLGCSWRPCKC